MNSALNDNFPRLVADVPVIALGRIQKTGRSEALFIGTVTEQTGVISDDDFSRFHLFYFFNDCPQYGWVGDDALRGLGFPQDIGLYQNLFPDRVNRKKVKDLCHGPMDIIVICRLNHDLVHSLLLNSKWV